MRAWVQANTQGIARRSSSDSTLKPRRAGRDPMGSHPTSSCGVTVANQGAKPSASTSSKNRARDASSRRFAKSSKERAAARSEEHTSELQSRGHLVCRLLLEKKTNATQ